MPPRRPKSGSNAPERLLCADNESQSAAGNTTDDVRKERNRQLHVASSARSYKKRMDELRDSRDKIATLELQVKALSHPDESLVNSLVQTINDLMSKLKESRAETARYKARLDRSKILNAELRDSSTKSAQTQETNVEPIPSIVQPTTPYGFQPLSRPDRIDWNRQAWESFPAQGNSQHGVFESYWDPVNFPGQPGYTE
ncbi:uncharacterized protein L203_105073 [Cryptococcus depauperatus CBS 7841]|uniref:BZIP domain-containing protein n=1 Tax=Cryptococcus depauperatus CBS 7841 TaxID=1295531 RepID=A0AAJ8JWN3_9TREE